ncbi:MAG: hypothetical protein EA428_08180 [Spirochaetaceae bacterium]|nr:MAG: hypothetical protein EA428_08180 [Spirochaetaceae bacterium]
MRSGPKHEIEALRDEVKQLRSEALVGTGDAVDRWRRAQEIESRIPSLREAIARQRKSNHASLEQALGEINSCLIFILAASNRPAELEASDKPEPTQAAVHRIFRDSLNIAIGFAQGDGSSAALHRQAVALRDELLAVATAGALDDPEQQRMLNTAELDLSYVTSGGKRPHSTRLAHLRASSE